MFSSIKINLMTKSYGIFSLCASFRSQSFLGFASEWHFCGPVLYSPLRAMQNGGAKSWS